MEREAFLVIVGASLGGAVVWLFALLLGRRCPRARSAAYLAWWHLVLPLLGGGVVIAFLLGWALQEPDPADEYASLTLRFLAAFTACVALRAFVRSLEALRSSFHASIPIGTVGLVKPRVRVSEGFRRLVPEKVLDAALAHEAAHVRRRDPARIWLAQLAADLQWPIPGTVRRFSEWVVVLEAERDNEAVASGAGPAELAEAILVAARLQCGMVSSINANAVGTGEGVAWRVRRLLSSEASGASPEPRAHSIDWAMRAGTVLLVLGALWLGFTYGDALLGVVPGVGR